MYNVFRENIYICMLCVVFVFINNDLDEKYYFKIVYVLVFSG